MNKVLIRYLLSFSVAILSTHAHAAPGERNWSVGALLGAASMNQGFGTKADWGFMIRDRFSSHLALGITITNVRIASASDSSGSASSNFLHIDADALYYLADSPSSLWLGARVGLGSANIMVQSGNSSSTASSKNYFDVGPVIGGDVMFSQGGSVGFDVSYLMTSFPAETLGTIQYLGTLKYHW